VTNADLTTRVETITTTIEVCNPCLSAEHVTIQAPDAFDLFEYILASGTKDMPAHGDFTVVTSPIVHTLCGDLVAVPSYTDGPVSFDDTDT
jgi:hypothetical protein